jgi:3-oxoadipate enol-lactonase
MRPKRIVFLHGIGGLAQGFDAHVEYFKGRGMNAYASNQPGYGGQAIVEPYAFEQIAQVLYSHLAKAIDEPTIVVGHSMGGMLAQTLAILNATIAKPLNLIALVLAQSSPAFGSADGAFQRRFIADRTAPLDAGQTMLDVAKRLVPQMVAPNCPQVTREFCVSMMARVPADTYKAALSALVAFDARPHLHELKQPTLCLAAEFDKTAPPAVLEKLAAKLEKGSYYCLPGLGHLAPMESPEMFCNAIESFMEERL